MAADTSPDDLRSLDRITRLVAFDTTSRDPNLPLIEDVADELRAAGLDPKVLPSPDGTKANLVCTIPDKDGGVTGGVVISGHTDVVPVDGQDWTTPPFEATVRDGRLYGRGTCDMKGYIGVALSTVPQLLAADLTQPVHLALTYDEEVGCIGGDQVVKDIADLGLHPQTCIVGEPSMMRAVPAHKAMIVMKVTFTGVAAHSSLTPKGVNAIEYAAQLVRFSRGIADGWRADGPFDTGHEVPHSTASTNVVTGGIAVNTVPDRCEVRIDVRAIGAVDVEEVAQRYADEARRIEGLMREENPAARVDFEITGRVPGFESAEAAAGRELAVALGAHATDEKVPYGTEAGLFHGAGVATVVCGPGDIAQAHGTDEYVELSQLAECEAFFDRLVEHLSA